MNQRPNVLAVAGSDSAGLAGIQRDNQTILALGGHPLNVISAATAQNAEGVKQINAISPEAFASQLATGMSQHPAAIKTGLLASTAQIEPD